VYLLIGKITHPYFSAYVADSAVYHPWYCITLRAADGGADDGNLQTGQSQLPWLEHHWLLVAVQHLSDMIQ